jgi:hypothetical protein
MKVFQVIYNNKNNLTEYKNYTPEEFISIGGINGIFQFYTKLGLAILDFGWI